MTNVVMRFPGGKCKAVTLSYDDGRMVAEMIFGMPQIWKYTIMCRRRSSFASIWK